ncbi:MAG: hypothetical protein AB1813_25500 [Verrucomicrobiota bacterium]
MKRRWNGSLWCGFALVISAALSYVPVFSRFPLTRDFPWANLLLFGMGGVFLGLGLKRAFGEPETYRGKWLGSILALLSALGFVMFSYGIFVAARDLPVADQAPRPGQKVPDFTLPDQRGTPVALSDLLSSKENAASTKSPRHLLLIFFRGFW